MQCKCGYRFTAPENRPSLRDGFAVIRDADYGRFLKSEMRAMAAPDREAKLAALGRSAAYVGSVHICPECGRLVFMRPLRLGKWSLEFYQIEEEAGEAVREELRLLHEREPLRQVHLERVRGDIATGIEQLDGGAYAEMDATALKGYVQGVKTRGRGRLAKDKTPKTS